MPYNGPPVICRFCGRSFTRPTSLVRHLDEDRCARKKSSTIVPARRGTLRAEVLDVTSSRSQTVRSGRSAPASPIQGETRIVPAKPLNSSQSSDSSGALTGLEAFQTETIAESKGAIRLPQANDEVTLWSQYHALKALAVRLDAGCATDREREAFESGLCEYNANFLRIRASRARALPSLRSRKQCLPTPTA
jgi:hypothetical protein